MRFSYSNCMGFLKKLFQLLSSPSHSRTAAILGVLVLLAAIPLTVLIAQKQQELRQHAAGATCNDISKLPDCSKLGVTVGSDCASKDLPSCRIDNAIIECAEQK